METRLQLLVHDGSVVRTFRPKLTAPQYDAILKAAHQWDDADELANAARQLANEWGIEVAVDFA